MSKQLTFDAAIIAKVREMVENGEIYIYLYSPLFRNETYIHSYISNKISVPEQAATVILSIQFSGKVCSTWSVLKRDVHQEFEFYKLTMPIRLNKSRLHSCFEHNLSFF